MSSINCDHETLFSTALAMSDKCVQISKACAEQQEIFNFFRFHTCHLKGNIIVFIIIAIILALFLTKFIIAVVDEYMAPAIVNLCDYLKMSEVLAGVTLLAFANGASDVITVLVVSGSGDSGVSYGLGCLYGSALFSISLVLAFAIQSSPKPIRVFKATIYRDILFYIIATSFILFMAFKGNITWMDSVFLLALYVILVILVIISESKKEEVDDNPVDQEMNSQSKLEQFKAIKAKLTDEEIEKLKHAFNVTLNYMKYKAKIREEEKGYVEQFMDILDYPFTYVRMLTVPQVHAEEYNHKKTVLWPVLGVIFMVWAIFILPQFEWIYTIPVSTGLIFIFLIFRPKTDGEVPSYFITLSIIAIINSVLWTKILCGVFVDLLTFIGVVTNLSDTYLGLTVLAMVNSLSDGLTAIAVARKGKAVMGITGSIGGCLFSLLIGFGLAMLKKTLHDGKPVPFLLFDMSRFDQNLLPMLVLGTAMFILLLLFFYGIFNDRKFDSKLASILKLTYITFMFVATVIAVYLATK